MKLLINLISIFLISCSDSKKHSHQLSQLEDWSVPLDTLTSNLSVGVRKVQLNRKAYVGMYSRNSHSINLWDMETKKKAFSISLRSNGQDGIYRLNSFYIKGMDSIFVFPVYYKELFLVDFNGHVKNKFVLNNYKAENNLDKLDLTGDMYSPTQFIGNKAIFGTLSSEINGLNPKFSSFPIGLTFDINTFQVNTNFMYYPENYWKKAYSMFNNFYFSDLDISEKNIVISFPVDDNIYVRDINGKLLKKVEAKSDFIDLSYESLKKEGQLEAEKFFLSNPSYNRILSDPFRKVYYRFALQKYDGKGNVPTLMMSSFKPLSVIILNEQFEKIGETLLPANKHFIFNAFVGKKGLYISNAHPNNPENDENKLSFTCYQLVKK
jgi:hypothetical protein